MGQQRPPRPIDRRPVRRVEPAEPEAPGHRGQGHRGDAGLAVAARFVDDLRPHPVGRLPVAHPREMPAVDVEHPPAVGMVRGKDGQKFRKAEGREPVAAAPGGGGAGVVVEQPVGLLQTGRVGGDQTDGGGEAVAVAGAHCGDRAEEEVVAPARPAARNPRRGLLPREGHPLGREPQRRTAVDAGRPGQFAEDHRPRRRREADALAEQRPGAGEPRSDLLQDLAAQRRIAVEGREPQRVHPSEGGDVADARRDRIAPCEHAGHGQRIARDAAGEGAAQRRPPVGRAGQRLAHDRRPVGRAGRHQQRVDGAETGLARRVCERRSQRAGRHGVSAALAGGPPANAPLVAGADLHHQVGGLVGDPAPDVTGLRSIGVVEEPVDRRKPARRRPRTVPRRMGRRQGADRPPRAFLVGRLGLEPPHGVDHDAGGGVRVALEPAHQDDAALGP